MQFTSPSSSLLSSPRIRTVSSSSVVVVDPLETTTTPASITSTTTTTSATSNSTTTSTTTTTPRTGFTTPISSTKQQKQDDSKSTKWQRIVSRHVTNLERKSPLVKKTMDTARRVPPRWRMIFLCGWLIWKVMSAYILLRITLHAGGGTLHMLGFLDYYGGESSTTTTTSSSRLQQQQQQQYSEHPTRLLYIVTALAEYNNGQRSTTKGQDRLAEVLIPVLVETVEALLSSKSSSRFDVDVYLVLGYELKPERRKLIQDRLPSSVGLEVWDDAIPLGYPKENGQKRITPNTRALARQHRFVIKDKMRYYDVFLALEDDMRMTGIQVQHFLDMTLELETLEAMAPETTTGVPEQLDGDPAQMKFYGNMTKGQLKRIVPGWIRVEVLNNEEKYGAQETLDPIELDYTFPLSGTEDGSQQQEQQQQQYYHLDPTICCHIPNMKPNRDTPNTKPNATDVIVWETNVRALQLREMPRYGSSSSSSPISDKLDWTVLLLGPGKREKQEEKVGGYWSGRTTRTSSGDGVATPPFGQDYKRPSGGPPDLVAQQGGWLLTRFQILRLDTELCQGSFLPPFSLPTYHEDGHQAMNVEYWSGSYQIFTGVRGGCNMQRIISFHPHHFSKHFVYHVANNKQKQLKQNRMVRANHIWGQLITVYKEALQSKKQQQQQQQEEERMKKQALTKKR